MDRGPLPLNAHAALEPLIAVVIAAAPWIFGFSDVDDATAVCVVLGAVVLVAGLLTDWRVSLARVIPIRAHMMTDMLVAAVLILAPFVLGFSDQGGPTRFMVIAGVLELLATLMTRWDPIEAAPTYTRDRRDPHAPRHG